MTGIRRFYKTVSAAAGDSGWQVRLDGRPVRTPGRAVLAVPSQTLAEGMVAEWDAQSETIRPDSMPLTQLASTAIDRVTPHRDQVIDAIAGFAATDLLCHRAAAPQALVLRQHAQWPPLLDWAASRLDAPLTATEGVMAVQQPAGSLAAIRAAVAGYDDFRVAALHVIASVTGSVVVALALLQGEIDAAAAWAVGQLDEDWQIERWGEEETAAERRRHLKAELDSAARFVTLL